MQSPSILRFEELSELMKAYGQTPVPLTRTKSVDERVRALAHLRPEALFPRSRSPAGTLAGLLLVAGCWDEAHEVASGLGTREGSYWHALIHRMEPETWNSDYWFGRVGEHPLFPAITERARSIAVQVGASRVRLPEPWDATRFNLLCDDARASCDPEFAETVQAIHSAEVHLLWDWCAAVAGKGAHE